MWSQDSWRRHEFNFQWRRDERQRNTNCVHCRYVSYQSSTSRAIIIQVLINSVILYTDYWEYNICSHFFFKLKKLQMLFNQYNYERWSGLQAPRNLIFSLCRKLGSAACWPQVYYYLAFELRAYFIISYCFMKEKTEYFLEKRYVAAWNKVV